MKKNIPSIFISIFFLIIYRLGSFSKIPFGDSAGKIIDIENNEFNLETYSITHFLYQNFTVLIYKIFPFIDAIEIGRWINIISALLVLFILFKTIYKTTENNWIAFITTIVFGFSFTFWKNTENVEVYTFSLIWIVSYCYFAISYLKTKEINSLLFAGIILGISFFSHIQGVLLLPSYIFLCFLNSQKKEKIFLTLIPILFLGLLYIYPIINQESIKNVLSSSSQSWVSNTFKKTSSDYLKDGVKAIGYLIYNFWFFNLFILFIPFKHFFRNTILIFLTLIGIPVFCFSTVYAVSDNYVFFLNFNLSYCILLAIGLQYFISSKPNLKYIISFIIFATPFNYYFAKEIALKTKKGQEFHQEKAYKDGLNYYLLPWMNNNKGIVEVTIQNEKTEEDIEWMKESARKIIKNRANKLSKDELNNL